MQIKLADGMVLEPITAKAESRYVQGQHRDTSRQHHSAGQGQGKGQIPFLQTVQRLHNISPPEKVHRYLHYRENLTEKQGRAAETVIKTSLRRGSGERG
jgi:hypothetical protein